MIEKLQKFFHTDKWWGKVLLIFLLYILYWFIFYIILFPLFGSLSGSTVGGSIFLGYIFLGIPFFSLIIPKIIKSFLKVNKILLYVLHFILIISSLFFFILALLSTMRPNFF